ncbi:hypothetical protein [Roseovarius salinarum]|uniref:hypothetical protein n=1 Tax=Roseovarius salinarum TaxID=1981892 RepID=UPI000C32591F|nr:hypothetical protein [Roseovarius salinarum]
MAIQKSPREKLGGWLALLAFAAMVLYPLYVVKWSGSTVAQAELRTSGTTRRDSVPLDPAMTPVRAVLDFEVRPQGSRVASYSVTVSDAGGNVVFDESGTASLSDETGGSAGPARGLSVNVGSFPVPAAGPHSIIAEITPRAPLSSAALVLRGNSAQWDFRIIAAIAGTFVFGFILGRPGRTERGS